MHLYFNVIGTILFMTVFYFINVIKPFPFMQEAATPFGIAAVHSIFNLAATLCLIPFSKGLVKLACMTVRDNEAVEETARDKTLDLLDFRFLETPSYAVEQSRSVAIVMAGLAEESMNAAMSLLDNYTEETVRQVQQLESRVDQFEEEIGSYLVKLSTHALLEKDSHTLSTILHCIGDFERISDYALDIMEAAKEMYDKKLEFSDKAKKEVQVFQRAVHDILNITMLSFREEDMDLARQIRPLEEVIYGLNLKIKRRHIKRLRKGKCTIELGFILADITTNFEKVASHCSNIAVCLLQVREDESDAYAYIDEHKVWDDMDFRSKVVVYGERYQLP